MQRTQVTLIGAGPSGLLLAELLERSGIDSGVSLTAMIETARWLQQQLGHGIAGLLSKAGLFPTSPATAPA